MPARSNNTPFWLLLIGLFLILVSNSLLTEGMFFDGVTYASISRNMAEGQGTFWNPHYTQTLYPEFRQHPPLALGMEALTFKVFGDHLWVEKAYSVLMFLLSGLLIALIWKRTTNNIRWAWLPLLFWLAIPLVTWSATNNMLENTMSVFVLLSVYLMIVSYQRNHKFWLFLAGGALFAAFLSKGFTGLFPLVFPILYCAFDQKRKWIQGPIDTLLLLVTLAVLSGVMFLVFPPSFAYLKDYIRLQVIGGGLHEATVSSRFSIVFDFLLQLMISYAIAIEMAISKSHNKVNNKVFEFPTDKSWFYTFLILGLLGVLPIMVSVKQRDFYMLAALPFFALAFGHLTLSMVNLLLPKITPKVHTWMTMAALVVLLVGLVLNGIHIGKYGRDEALIEEVKAKIAETEGQNIIDIPSEQYTQWARHAYFMRYGKISLNPTDNNGRHMGLSQHQPINEKINSQLSIVNSQLHNMLLNIKNLHVSIGGKEILKGLNLGVNEGEIHAIMGPNGTGKSTLAAAITGREGYEITEGEIWYKGKNIVGMSPEDRANEGIFLSFQYPVEIPGVSIQNFMRTAVNSKREYQGLPPMSTVDFMKMMKEKQAMVEITEKLQNRFVNVGYSGGEKKKNEIFQMAMLEPSLAILDETDSGLDIDALRIVAHGVNQLHNAENAFVVITHYQRLLDYIVPDFVHVMYDGRIVKTGGKNLALELEEKGYEWIKEL